MWFDQFKKAPDILQICQLFNRMTVADFAQTDLAYAPPFSPVWDPVLTAANQLLKEFI